MKILHAHNAYLTTIKKCVEYFESKKTLHEMPYNICCSEFEWVQDYDALMLEIDCIYLFGRAMIAHEKSYNPLKWLGIIGWSAKLHGTLNSYVKKAHDAGVRIIMIEFKDSSEKSRDIADDIVKAYPAITFVWLDDIMGSVPYRSNTYSLSIFAAQHEIESKDLY